MMTRRAFLCGLTLGALSAPLAVEAQQAGKVYRVAIIIAGAPVSEGSKNPYLDAFTQRLRDLGYVEGQNIIIERRSAEGHAGPWEDLVAEAIRLNPDVLVTVANRLAQAAKRATTTIPIVMATSSQPVESGLVSSLARPGGTVTGQTIDTGPEFEAKRLELFKEVVPRISRVAYIGTKFSWEREWGASARKAARLLGMELGLIEVAAPDLLRIALGAVARDRFDGLYSSVDPQTFTVRQVIADFAAQRRLPVASVFREAAEAGALFSYGVSLLELYRGAAVYVVRILKGARPADLPVEQPTKFELVINLKTAKALGLTIPPSLLLRADHVIE